MSSVEKYLKYLNPGEGNWATRDLDADEGSIMVEPSDVVAMLESYKNSDISYDRLLDWANLVLFNDAFDYDGDQVRDELDRIEESDEPGKQLTENVVAGMLDSLRGK